MYFSGSFILPVPPMLQCPVKLYRAGAGTIINTAAAVPALIRMQYHWRLALLGVGDININLANFHAVVAPVTDILVKSNRIIRCRQIRYGNYFFLSHFFLQNRHSASFSSTPISSCKHQCSLYYRLHTVFSCCPKKSAVVFRS